MFFKKWKLEGMKTGAWGIALFAAALIAVFVIAAYSATFEIINPKVTAYEQAVSAFKLRAEKTCTALRLAAKSIPTATPTPTVAVVPKPTATPVKK